jgi:hypothetical protein
MTRIQFLSVAAISGVLVAGALPYDGVLAITQACSFRVVWAVGPPTITGTASITKRVDFIPQEGAPIRILAVDVSKAKVSLEVVNVTDEAVRMVHPWVQVLRRGRPVHKGGGLFVRRPLAPGERLRFDVDYEGVLFGTMDDDTRLQVSMSMVDFGACKWRDRRWGEAWRRSGDPR